MRVPKKWSFYYQQPLAKQTWTSPLEALEDALLLEHAVNNALLDLHWEAQMKNDPHVSAQLNDLEQLKLSLLMRM